MMESLQIWIKRIERKFVQILDPFLPSTNQIKSRFFFHFTRPQQKLIFLRQIKNRFFLFCCIFEEVVGQGQENLHRKLTLIGLKSILINSVSISPILYARLFRTKVLNEASLYSESRLILSLVNVIIRLMWSYVKVPFTKA
jgi:hypothetical protein